MAKDRLLFLLSFALLGLVAAFLFRGSEPDIPADQIALVDQILPQKVEPKKMFPVAPGKMAIPYQLTTRQAIVQFFHQGQYIDVIFSSKSDMGFGTITLTLLKNIRILDIGRDSEGKQSQQEEFNKNNGPLEILLEMTPREAEVFSYADTSGTVSFAISEHQTTDAKVAFQPNEDELSLDWGDDDGFFGQLDDVPSRSNDELAQELLNSSSDENFNSILVTHMLQSLFPKAESLKVTVTPRGYIIEGKAPNPETAEKIVQILGTLSSDGSKTVINLMKEENKWAEVLVARQNIRLNDPLTPKNYSWEKLKVDNVTSSLIVRSPQSEKWIPEVAASKQIPKGELIALNDVRWPNEIDDHERGGPETPTLPPEPGTRMVPFFLTEGDAIGPELWPGCFVDVRFATKMDVGIDVGNLTLFNDIRVLALRDINGRNLREMPGRYQAPAMIILELTPHQAEILSYARHAGFVFVELSGEDTYEPPNGLAHQLLASKSAASFRSILITHMIRSFFPRINIKVTAGTRGYAIEGIVPDPQTAAKIIEIFAKFVPGSERELVNLLLIKPQQVRICVKVYEVQRNVLLRLGLNWELILQNGASSAAFGAVYPRPGPNDANFFLDAHGIKFGSFSISSLIDMLERDGCGKILAEPNLTTISGETAHFFAGGEFPILVPQGGTLLGTVTVEFKKFGVLLDFTPFVDLNGLITMHIVPEVSNLDKENSVILEGFVIPSLLTRRVDTIVKLWPGQSYLIAGMYLDEMTKRDDNLYGFNRLPVIGPLFDSFRDESHQQELVIIVTPYLSSEEESDYYYEGTICYPAEACEFDCMMWKE